jgi:peptidoglycan hydrolase-like amidase
MGADSAYSHVGGWLCWIFLFFGFSLSAEVVEIGVFGLFRPVELRVTPASGPLLVTNGDARVELEGRQSFSIRVGRFSGTVRVGARDGSATDFRLSVPGKIERQFHGALLVRALPHKLQAVVSMDREVAVASVVAAEMPPTAPLEALKAQAVVARSYYAAGHDRHAGFAFCDTTHCQFLRAWPAATSPPFRATQETRGLVLEYLGQPLAALYSASCGGQTRALEETDGEETGAYPYYSVPCDFCRRHSPGVVRGHQLGLCQAGAAGMAASGATFQAILDHYLPGTAIFLLPPSPTLRHSND